MLSSPRSGPRRSCPLVAGAAGYLPWIPSQRFLSCLPLPCLPFNILPFPPPPPSPPPRPALREPTSKTPRPTPTHPPRPTHPATSPRRPAPTAPRPAPDCTPPRRDRPPPRRDRPRAVRRDAQRRLPGGTSTLCGPSPPPTPSPSRSTHGGAARMCVGARAHGMPRRAHPRLRRQPQLRPALASYRSPLTAHPLRPHALTRSPSGLQVRSERLAAKFLLLFVYVAPSTTAPPTRTRSAAQPGPSALRAM